MKRGPCPSLAKPQTQPQGAPSTRDPTLREAFPLPAWPGPGKPQGDAGQAGPPTRCDRVGWAWGPESLKHKGLCEASGSHWTAVRHLPSYFSLPLVGVLFGKLRSHLLWRGAGLGPQALGCQPPTKERVGPVGVPAGLAATVTDGVHTRRGPRGPGLRPVCPAAARGCRVNTGGDSRSRVPGSLPVLL